MRKQWRCFFCDQVFTRRQDAAEHFGAEQEDSLACQITAHEGHLVHYIRDLEARLRRHDDESTDVMRSIMTLEADTARKVRQAEEKGFARGVEDMKAQGYCADPQAHSITKAA